MTTMESTVRSVITPNDQFLRTVFGTSRAYYIDIYQREYKWTPANVETLLRDIETRFETGTRSFTDPHEIQVAVQEQFEPYFLNTYLTHSTSAAIYIVDGQQRLTTFLLIFIKLYQIIKAFEAEKAHSESPDDEYFRQKTFSSQALEKLIFESNDFGEACRFKIFNENREVAFRSLVDDGDGSTPSDETQQRIKENYAAVSSYFDRYMALEEQLGRYDIPKLTYYLTYILDRISIVEIKIEKQQNVATIFEVVNDRGLGLKPYEILKGKLLGNLRTEQKEEANRLWTRIQDDYFRADIRNSTEAKADMDMFFRTFFRAKFADSESDYERYERDYHYEVYRNNKIRRYLHDFGDADFLYRRLTDHIQYFADLYLRLRTSYDDEFLIYNKLLDQNQQYLLVLSCIRPNDPDEKAKITGIARKFDQFHTVLRLLDVYDSNAFQRMLYSINRDIRNKSLSDAEAVFDSALIANLEAADVLRKSEVSSVQDLFTYERFQGARNRWTNFSKYVLMRIDRYLAQLLDKPSYVKSSLVELEERFNKTGRRRYGMHLEHIYAYNESNMALFTDSEHGFNENLFASTRNLLGMVLLLKDKQNVSSSNEIYRDKVQTYKMSNLIWNELLAGHLDRVDVRNLPPDLQFEKVEPDDAGAFPRERVDARQRLLFNAIRHIWCDPFA
jgi:uncharacterized protein with ParB-like and HNH nuclease domain